MSWLSELNPLNWIKDALISDFVGGKLRHLISAVGGILLAKGLGKVANVQNWQEATIALLTDPEFIGGVIGMFTADKASVANKKAE